jgi:NTE family protein
MEYGIENLVFEGGGVKGLAFCGALQVLEEKGIMSEVKRVAGSSAGAITAGLLTCGFTPHDILEEVGKKNFNDFKDEDFGVFRDVKRLMTEYGYYAGKEFHDWYGRLLEAKSGDADITFGDVFRRYKKELIITGTCLNRRETHFYNRKRNKDMPVRDAVRISMSIPLFFAAVEWQGDLLVDGGVMNNYPIWIFDGEKTPDPKNRHNDPNPKTLGLKLLTEEEVEETVSGEHLSNGIYNLKDFTLSLVDCLMTQIDRLHFKPGDWNRTIAINTRQIKTTQFDLTQGEKELLLEEGRKGAEKFFAWYDANKG